MKVKLLSLACLVLAALFVMPGCNTKGTPPAMPQIANPVPAEGASPLEVERYQLEEEKRSLSEKYADHVDRIQQINTRLIQINIELHRQANPHN